MLVDWMNRTPEQRTLNPRVGSRWLPALSLYLAAATHATRRAGQRRSRLRYQGWQPGPFPMFRAPGEESGPRSHLSGTHAEHPALPGTRNPSAGTSELHARASPHARGPGMAVRTPHAARRPPQRAAPPAERQPACRAATLPAARPDGSHVASRGTPPVRLAGTCTRPRRENMVTISLVSLYV